MRLIELLVGNITNENSWLINNGIYYAGRLGKFHSNPYKGLEVITKAMSLYPRLSGPYFCSSRTNENKLWWKRL